MFSWPLFWSWAPVQCTACTPLSVALHIAAFLAQNLADSESIFANCREFGLKSQGHRNDFFISRTVSFPPFPLLSPFPFPPHLHLTTSKVMVIVWSLRGNIILNRFIYCQRATSSMGTVNRNSSYSPVGSLCFLGCMIYLYVHVCFVLPWSVESFPFMLWRWRNKLK